MKRFFDFICSLLAIILLSPVLLLLSMVILIDSGRPIVFRQKRVGLNNQLFDIRKRMETDRKKLDKMLTIGMNKKETAALEKMLEKVLYNIAEP